MMGQLKPCPFCGSNNIEHYIREPEGGVSFSMIECQICFARTMEYRNVTSEEMVEVWNRRASGWMSVEDGLPKRVEGKHYSIDLLYWLPKENAICSGYYVFPDIEGINYGWKITNNEDGYSVKDITHWMPLPEPPEK